MKKVILVGLMAVSFSTAYGVEPEEAGSALCGSIAELAKDVVGARNKGEKWSNIQSRLTFDKLPKVDSILKTVLRDAYYQNLDEDTTRTLAYSSCKMQITLFLLTR